MSHSTYIKASGSKVLLDFLPVYLAIAILYNYNMGCTIQSNFELNNILTGHEVKGTSNNFRIPIKEDETATLSILRENTVITSTVTSGNNFSSLYKPTKVLDAKDNIISPNRIAFNINGMWAVTDGAKHCVNIFNSQDELIQVIGGTSDSENQFKNPKGVAFDGENCLYVVDSGNHRIVKFDIDSNYLLQFSTKGSGNRQFSDPSGIAIHDDKVYVADSGNCHIAVFKTDAGQFCFTFGSEEFGGVLDVSISPDNHVLVSNWSDEAVHVFTLDGECINKFGKRGYYKTPLNYPYCLTTESNGYTLIAEYYNHRLSVFDKEGALVHSLGSKGSALGQFQYIEGIGVSPNGKIYISDNGNHRIQIF